MIILMLSRMHNINFKRYKLTVTLSNIHNTSGSRQGERTRPQTQIFHNYFRRLRSRFNYKKNLYNNMTKTGSKYNNLYYIRQHPALLMIPPLKKSRPLTVKSWNRLCILLSIISKASLTKNRKVLLEFSLIPYLIIQ